MDADVDLITDGPRFHQGRRAGGTKPKIWQALWSSAGKMARQVADVDLCAGNVYPRKVRFGGRESTPPAFATHRAYRIIPLKI